MITIVLLIASQMMWYTLSRSQSLVVVHTNLIAITYLITDRDLIRIADRYYIPDN